MLHRLLLVLLVISAIGVVAGETLRGAWLLGVILGGMVIGATWHWWRIRKSTDAADPLALTIIFLANALAGWSDVEAWIARVLG